MQRLRDLRRPSRRNPDLTKYDEQFDAAYCLYVKHPDAVGAGQVAFKWFGGNMVRLFVDHDEKDVVTISGLENMPVAAAMHKVEQLVHDWWLDLQGEGR